MRRLWALLALVGLVFAAMEVPAVDFAKKSLGGGFVPVPPWDSAVNCNGDTVSQAVRFIFPGDNWDDSVACYPESTWFVIKAGIHDGEEPWRKVLRFPKPGNVFWGEDGAILSGMDTLGAEQGYTWLKKEGRHPVSGADLWYTTGVSSYNWYADSIPCNGTIDSAGHACKYRYDVVIRPEMLRQVWLIDSLDTDLEFFYDLTVNPPQNNAPTPHGNDTLWLFSDPNLKTVEFVQANSQAIGNLNGVDNVTVHNLIIEGHANSPNGSAALGSGDGTDWLISDCEFRFNHAAGLGSIQGGVIRNSHFHHNGQMGTTGPGDWKNALYQGNEFSHNNRQEVSWGWASGGTKTIVSAGVVYEGNHFHNNSNFGFWTDIDSTVVFRNNLHENNGRSAEFENTMGATIYSNTFSGDAVRGCRIANGFDITVIHNTLTVVDTSSTAGDFGAMSPGIFAPGGITVYSGLPTTNERSTNRIYIRNNETTWGDDVVSAMGYSWNASNSAVHPDSLVVSGVGGTRIVEWNFNRYIAGSVVTPFSWPSQGTPSGNQEFTGWQSIGFDAGGSHDSS
jgi:hypothetical protein